MHAHRTLTSGWRPLVSRLPFDGRRTAVVGDRDDTSDWRRPLAIRTIIGHIRCHPHSANYRAATGSGRAGGAGLGVGGHTGAASRPARGRRASYCHRRRIMPNIRLLD